MTNLRTWSIVLGAVGLRYVLAYHILPGRVDGILLAYVISPVLWLLVGVIAFLGARRAGVVLAEWDRRLLEIAAGAGVLQVAVLFLAGLLWGLGASPYLMTLAGIATNAMHVFMSLLGIEIVRVSLVRTVGPRRLLAALIGSSVVVTLSQIPPATYSRLTTPGGALSFAGTRLLPELSENVVAGLLALLGGVPAAFLYRSVLAAAHWFSPILPDLPWAPAAFLGTTVPVLLLLFVGNAYRDRLSTDDGKSETTDGGASSAIRPALFGLLVVVLFWFVAGLFGSRPVLIASRSMEPAIKLGDIVVVVPTDPSKISVNDVIAFQQAGASVPFIHRVIEVRSENGEVVFVTKGDANDSPDEDPVRKEHIKGKVWAIVPKVGWLAIAAKNAVAALPLS